MNNTKLIRQLFPFSFTAKKDVLTLVIVVLIHIGAGAVIGFVINLFSHLFLVGLVIGLVGGLVDLYLLVGVVLTVLDYLKILK